MRYLLCHPDGHNNQAVANLMDELQLYCPLDRQLDQLRRKYKPPVPFRPTNMRHEPSIRFIRDAGIYSLFYPDLSTKRAFAILEKMKIRAAVEQMLSQNANHQQIVDGLSRHYKFASSVNGVAKYQYLFFSDDCTRDDLLEAVIWLKSGCLGSEDKSVTIRHNKAENRARFHDPHVAAIEMPACPQALEVVLEHNGFVVVNQKHDVEKEIDEVSALARRNMALELRERKPHSAHNFMALANGLQTLNNVKETLKAPAETVYIKASREVRMLSDTNKPVTIRQISAGNCTTEVQPLGKTAGEPVEAEPAGVEDAEVEELEHDEDEREFT